MATPILEVSDLGISFGGLQAVADFHLNIEKGELVGLIGPNGAGKTTIFNLLTGVYQPTEGTILLCGKSTAKKRPDQLANAGIARTFQNIRLFKELTVLENVMIACNESMHYSIFSSIFRLPSYWREERQVKEKALSLLNEFDLADYADYRADNLPYGQQRRLEIARAMGTNPQILLLDEPAAGMNPTETQSLMDTIEKVKSQFGISILLIEHDMRLVLGICQRILVLDYGRIIAQGKPEMVIQDPKVITAYLGE